MKLRAVLVIAVLSAGACSVGGANVSLGSGPLESAAGAGGDTPTASAGASNGAAGLNVEPSPMDAVCSDGKKTSISGSVWDPAGAVPLYNAVVYVPREPGQALPAFPDMVACEKCTDSVSARAVTLSGPDGTFRLDDVPYGNVEVVVQLGKWRRKQIIPIKPCQDNPIADPGLRLPKSHAEGDIPKIALSTGHSDALECLLRKIGIADSEFTTDAGDGQVNLFVGCEADNASNDGIKHTGASRFVDGTPFPSTNRLFDSGELPKYDVLVLSCEGHKCDTIQTPPHIAQLVDFADRGGRVFLDHEHYNWLNHAVAPIKSAAQFDHMDSNVTGALATKINRTFPKGEAFAQWLLHVSASTQLGALNIYTAQTSVLSLSPNRSQSWIYRDQHDLVDPDGFFYFTIGTPVAVKDDDPPPDACGRVVFTDLHLSKTGGGEPTSDDFSDQLTPFPSGCTTSALSAQEKALEFMFFDLSSCVQQESAIPTPPVVK